jgi:hypothetical protein
MACDKGLINVRRLKERRWQRSLPPSQLRPSEAGVHEIDPSLGQRCARTYSSVSATSLCSRQLGLSSPTKSPSRLKHRLSSLVTSPSQWLLCSISPGSCLLARSSVSDLWQHRLLTGRRRARTCSSVSATSPCNWQLRLSNIPCSWRLSLSSPAKSLSHRKHRLSSPEKSPSRQ